MKRKKQQQKLEKNQVRAFIFLGVALSYFILGQAVIASYEVFPFAKACICNSKSKKIQPENEKQTKLDKITIGVFADPKKEIIEEKDTFSSRDSQINLKIGFLESGTGEEVSCYFYYMGNEEFSKPFLVGSEKNITKGVPQETLNFKLQSTGNEWQLKGDFRAIISIPSSDIKEERNFSIL